ncbi:hypothetical protein GLYMA_10G121650v4 [Glycine max]|nr:hypothetical protein GLYMA_10G121650v4 [Glycine max]KAH1137886.1 hypothetical protein GYH30_027751 [Glycine max]
MSLYIWVCTTFSICQWPLFGGVSSIDRACCGYQ